MKVSLIFPREFYAIETGGAEYPLGILYIATYLLKNKIDCSVHDLTFSTWKILSSELLERNPDVVGFSIFTPIAHSGLKAIELTKRILPNAIIVVGGPHACVDSLNIIRHPNVDIVIYGEGEKVFLDLIETLENDRRRLSSVKGIIYKENGEIIQNSPAPIIENLDELPFPDRNLLNIEKYLKITHTFSLITSRGCPSNCFYCQPTQRRIFGSKIRRRTPENVVSEMQYLIKWFHNRRFNFYFVDDTFTYDKKWLKEFCELIITKYINTPWRCITRVDKIDDEVAKELKQANCEIILFGVESGSQRILSEIMKKNISLSQTKNAFKITHKYGLIRHAFIMIGTPSETKKELNMTVELIKDIHPDNIQISITTPMLGSYLYDYCNENKSINIKNFNDFDYCKNEYPIKLENLTREDLILYKSKIINAHKGALYKNLGKYIRILYLSNQKKKLVVGFFKLLFYRG